MTRGQKQSRPRQQKDYISSFDGEEMDNFEGDKKAGIFGALAGALSGQTQPTINTVVVFDEKSYDNMLFKTAAVAILMIVIWAFARHYSNGNVS